MEVKVGGQYTKIAKMALFGKMRITFQPTMIECPEITPNPQH